MFVSILVAAVILYVAAYLYFWNRSHYFRRRGIPGPKPTSVFSGNLRELQSNRRPYNSSMLRWEKEFGETFGYLEGGQRVICTSNLSVLHDVFSKKFESFHSRKPIHPFPFNPDKDERVNVFTSRGLRWKRLRTLTSPSFSTSKLRMMQGILIDTTKTMMRVFESMEGQKVNMCKWFLESSTDVIERIAFGKEESGIGKEPNPVTNIIRAFFNPPPYIENPVINFYVSTFEFTDWTVHLHKILIKLKGSPLSMLGDQLVETITKRRNAAGDIKGKSGEPKDFVDLFLRAEATEEELETINSQKGADVHRANASVNRKLTDQEIISMCSVLMLAGVDTTATAMSCLAYQIAVNEEVQNKLVMEIDDFISTEEDINYDNMNNLTYLDWCIKESLRLAPLAGGANSRICMKTSVCGDNDLLIEEGVTVAANVWSIHYDKRYWGDDASEYIPERWNPEYDRIPKNPLCYQPFGAGPRTCLGMRFAFLEMKLMFCHLLKRFRLERCEKTKLNMSGILGCAPHDVYVVLRRRTSIESD